MASEYTPTEKSSSVESAISSTFGLNRRSYILAGKCVMTGEDAGPFRDELSEKEYQISGLGQKAQDEIWGN